MTRWVRAPALLWRRTLHGMVAQTPDGRLVELSPAAAAVVTVLDEPRTVEEAAATLAEASGAPADVVTGDLDAALPELAQMGVLSERP